jgi:hypothetical protein
MKRKKMSRRGQRMIILSVATIIILFLLGLLYSTYLNSSSGPTDSKGQVVQDRFSFEYQSLTGNGSIVVRVKSFNGIITYPPPNNDQIVEGLVPWARAGVMIKSSLVPGSDYAAVMQTGSYGIRMQYSFVGNIAGSSTNVTQASPIWLKILRSGDVVSGYESNNGTQWSKIGSAGLGGLPATVEIGFFVNSPCDLTVSKGNSYCRFTQANADFDSISLGGNVSGSWTYDYVGKVNNHSTDWELYHRAEGVIQNGTTFNLAGTGDIALSNSSLPLITYVFFGGIIVVVIIIAALLLRRTRTYPKNRTEGLRVLSLLLKIFFTLPRAPRRTNYLLW